MAGKLNVANREAVFAWADEVVRDHGKVNLIFNNAGVVWGTQAFLPHLKRAGDGHVVNTSSLFGLLASPTQGTYNASKFATRGYTEALRQELDMAACGVSATCVHPGGIRTNIARTAKMDDSMNKATGGQAEAARSRFDKMLNVTTAESAARQILRAVEGNQRPCWSARMPSSWISSCGCWAPGTSLGRCGCRPSR
jgi:short-subunit dehydrogenase